MRKLTTLLLTAGVSGTALGHELPGAESHLQQLLHHLLSLHHAPAILLVLAAGLAVYLASRRESE